MTKGFDRFYFERVRMLYRLEEPKEINATFLTESTYALIKICCNFQKYQRKLNDLKWIENAQYPNIVISQKNVKTVLTNILVL